MYVGELTQIEVESLNYSAYAVGRTDSFVIFVNGAVPGDRLVVKITQIKKNYAVAEMVDILSASPHRCNPPCVHFSEGCGGCQWQNIAYEYQLRWKKEIVRQALKRIGKLDHIPEIELHDINHPLHYRNKLRLFSRVNGNLLLGMRRHNSHEVVPIRKCLISLHEINSLSSVFQGEVFSAGSTLDEVSIRASESHKQIMLSCIYRTDDPHILTDTGKLSQLPGADSIFSAFGQQKPTLRYGEPNIREKINGIEYKISPDSFFQVNVSGLKYLINLVKEFAGRANKLILDAHCGVGTFALQVTDLCDTVWGTDVSSSAIELAHSNSIDNNITNARFRKGTVADILESDLRNAPINLAILDPPRQGCEKADLHALIRSQPAKVIYISCNPTTLARDLHELNNADYRLDRLAMVDMFPMTYHLETVAFCIRRICFKEDQ